MRITAPPLTSYLRRLVIGESVSSIGANVFAGIINPDTIFIHATVPPTIMPNTFESMPTNAKIRVPCHTTEDYQNAYYWNVFTSYSENPSCSSNGIDNMDGTELNIYANDGRIVVEGAEGMEVTLYDAVGRRIKVERKDEKREIRIAVPTSGVYLLKIGNYPARRVVVVR